MPTISIVTPVYNGGHHYIKELYECLCEQELPAGWCWQWVVQEDGKTGIPGRELPVDDSRISLGEGRAGGAAMARTVAMSRVTGEFTRGVDADDLLAAGSLYRDIDTLMSNPEFGWCVSGCMDLHPDGSLTPGPYDPEPGPLPSGFLADGHRIGKLQVMGTTMAAHTDLIHAVGGWQAVPYSEDVALLLACEAVSDGWMIREISELYRQREIQTVTDPAYSVEAEKEARTAVIFKRVEALRASGWRWRRRRVLAR